jgi:hypothetical protein
MRGIVELALATLEIDTRLSSAAHEAMPIVAPVNASAALLDARVLVLGGGDRAAFEF